MDESKFRKPAGTKGRRPEALVRGKPYLIKQFAREKSLFTTKSGGVLFKFIAIYEDIGMTFHTYMPTSYDNFSDEKMEQLEKDASGNNVRIVFYGKISGANEVDILKNDEVVNKEKLEGIALIEQAEKSYSPMKRRMPENAEPSTSKQQKTD